MWFKTLKFLSTFSQFRFWLSPKASLFQNCTTCRKLSFGILMEDFRLLVRKKKQFEGQVFTLSIASFGGIGKSESQIKDRNTWLCNQVCLLKCKRFDWHWSHKSKLSWFLPNWIWVSRHYPCYKNLPWSY